MSTGTNTPNLGMHNWVGTDKVLRTEFNDNFTNIDAWAGKVNAISIPYATDSSASPNTVTVTLSPAPTSYTDGMALCVKIANTSTGASTLNVNGLGAVAIKNGDGTAIGSGDLVAGVPVTLRYVGGGSPAFIASGSGGLSGAGNATAADVRAPKTFTSSSGKKQTGTLADNGNGPTVNPSTSTQTLGPGIYDTAITINPVTGSAAAAHVLSGDTFSSANGINQTGSMPNNAALTVTPNSNTQNFGAGYYPSVTVNPVPSPSNGSQTFTSSGTFTVPSGVTRLWVELWGGGGGGAGGSGSYYGGSGGGGSYVFGIVDVSPNQSVTVTVGGGGAAGASYGAGGAGGNSNVGNLTAGGGGAGQPSSGSGNGAYGSPGVASTTDALIAYNGGDTQHCNGAGSGGSNGSTSNGILGGGGAGGYSAGSNTPGTVPGGAGSGGAAVGAGPGAAGARGQVIIRW